MEVDLLEGILLDVVPVHICEVQIPVQLLRGLPCLQLAALLQRTLLESPQMPVLLPIVSHELQASHPLLALRAALAAELSEKPDVLSLTLRVGQLNLDNLHNVLLDGVCVDLSVHANFLDFKIIVFNIAAGIQTDINHSYYAERKRRTPNKERDQEEHQIYTGFQ